VGLGPEHPVPQVAATIEMHANRLICASAEAAPRFGRVRASCFVRTSPRPDNFESEIKQQNLVRWILYPSARLRGRLRNIRGLGLIILVLSA
jgi:hypothetical protein